MTAVRWRVVGGIAPKLPHPEEVPGEDQEGRMEAWYSTRGPRTCMKKEEVLYEAY